MRLATTSKRVVATMVTACCEPVGVSATTTVTTCWNRPRGDAAIVVTACWNHPAAELRPWSPCAGTGRCSSCNHSHHVLEPTGGDAAVVVTCVGTSRWQRCNDGHRVLEPTDEDAAIDVPACWNSSAAELQPAEPRATTVLGGAATSDGKSYDRRQQKLQPKVTEAAAGHCATGKRCDPRWRKWQPTTPKDSTGDGDRKSYERRLGMLQ